MRKPITAIKPKKAFVKAFFTFFCCDLFVRVILLWIFASWNIGLKAGKKLTKITDKCEENNQL